jgi:hypothetical protein
MQSVFFSEATRRHRMMQLSQLNNIKKGEIILSVATAIQLVIQIIDVSSFKS